MFTSRFLRYTSGLIASALIVFGPTAAHAVLSNTYVTQVQAQLTKLHGGTIATASVANLKTALNNAIIASASTKLYASSYVNAVLANRTDAAAIDASIALTGIAAAGSTTAAAVSVVTLSLTYVPVASRAALLNTLSINQRTILGTIAKGAIQSSAGNSTTARTYLTAILTARGISITDYAAFAATAISGAPTGSIAKTVAELVATKVPVASQVAFAGALAAKQSSSLAAYVAVGVGHSAPLGSYKLITAAVATSNAANILASPTIASVMTGAMQLEYASYIATQLGSSLRLNVNYPALSGSIAYSIALQVNAKTTRTTDERAQEIAAEAYALISYLSPSSLSSQARVTAVIAKVAKAVAGTTYSDIVAGTLYKALKAVQTNATYLAAVRSTFLANLVTTTSKTAASNAIAKVNAKTDTYKTGPLQLAHSAFVN